MLFGRRFGLFRLTVVLLLAATAFVVWQHSPAADTEQNNAQYTRRDVHLSNAQDPAFPGRHSWRGDRLPANLPYSGPSDVMAANAFNEKISAEIGSLRDVPDTRTAGYACPLRAFVCFV